MENLQTSVIGIVGAGQQAVISVQFDVPFPDINYGTGISLASNALASGEAGPKGLQIVSIEKRQDGVKITLLNPAAVDQLSDTVQVWAGN